MAHRLGASLRDAPVTVPALAAMTLFIVWATNQAGYPVTHWAPGGLIMLTLVGISLLAVGLRVADIPLPVRIALVCLLGYTVLSFLSITWADVPGDAWEGANRTLLYLLVFTLFACWRQRGVSAAVLLVAWTLAMIVLATFVALHIDGASGVPAHIDSLMPGGRLIYPSGYANANAAQWMMAFWPAVLLARSRELPWGLRAVLAGGSVLLAEVALMSLSRGSLYATPIMLVLVFALLPGRVRTFALFVPVAAGIAVVAPSIVHASEHVERGQAVESALHGAIASTFWAALVVGLVVGAGSAIESRAQLSDVVKWRMHTGLGGLAVAVLIVVVVGGWLVSGNPLARVEHAWDTFKSEKGYAANSSGGRLLSGLGSTRYDLYRVELNEFVSHPLVGIGVDNIQQQYLRHGRSEETPRYPHSVELRTLVETGLIGSVLALVGFGAALLATGKALRARRESDPLASAIAAAALAGFGYWVVHGSFDWFWEFAGLGAPAFAMLGICCSLTPRSRSTPARGALGEPAAEESMAITARGAEADFDAMLPSARPRRGRRVALATVVLLLLAMIASLVGPWLSDLQIENAARVWTRSRADAYVDLDEAARLNPLSAEPYLLAGSISLRYGDLSRAEHQFEMALQRSPDDSYATLELGAIASAKGQSHLALALLERAAFLNPRGVPTREALELVRSGHRVNITRLDHTILVEGQRLA